MPEYTFKNERAKQITITTIDEAKRVIIATATVREHTHEELLEDAQIKSVADAFNIDLNTVLVTRSVNPNDFYFTYKFVEEIK